MKTLNQIYSKSMEGVGIFSFFPNDMPWGNDEDFITYLNYLYYGIRSGEKYAAPFVERIAGDELTDLKASIISNMLYAKYGKNWQKLWDTLNLDYNPINNYDMQEEETREPEKNRIVETHEGDIIRAEDGKEIDTKEGSEKDTSKVAGFNSENFVNADENTRDYTDRKDTRSYENRKTTETDGRKYTTEESYNRVLKRSGNIGVTTSQQMIQSERDLWKWQYFNSVFKDIDTEIAVGVWPTDY